MLIRYFWWPKGQKSEFEKVRRSLVQSQELAFMAKVPLSTEHISQMLNGSQMQEPKCSGLGFFTGLITSVSVFKSVHYHSWVKCRSCIELCKGQYNLRICLNLILTKKVNFKRLQLSNNPLILFDACLKIK